ncbi:LmeA family phospholipid-binding protein [Allocoleopsis franciscana]|uniref:DUF2993 domain-containing protein n=1 Tax=Allocoleopsis franciscana PCC 7113 TaxID=1173027 RepID=K9WEP5_9CYAN|nr:DUF2993 domain-containing protein [Allocoleopsis franciscana]AFZ18234.1 Protein of unknown function (DUF2993) [Allocoleopsis franciscana PCC 7113]
MPNEPRLEEQAVSEAAEMAIAAQFDEVENIDVEVRTDLVKMVQGHADSVSIAAQGVVMQKDIRVQEMEVHTNRIAIDLLRTIFGHVELDTPLDATARVELTEQDLNRALNSDYIRSQFQSLELDVEGQIITLEPQQLKIHLSGDGKIGFSGTIVLNETGKTRRMGFTALIRLPIMQQPLLLEAFQCTEGEGISLELALTFLNKARELMDSPYFEIEGVALCIKKLDVQSGRLSLYTDAYVRQLPETHS